MVTDCGHPDSQCKWSKDAAISATADGAADLARQLLANRGGNNL